LEHLQVFFLESTEYPKRDKDEEMKKDEQLKIELDIALEEYRTMKTEIVSNLDAARQIVHLALTAIAILIGAVPVIVQSHSTILFLIAPLLFFALAWSQLRYIYLVLDMGKYLNNYIVPNVQRLLSEISTSKNDFSQVMSWEMPGKGPTRLRGNLFRGLLFFPIAGANLGISLLAILGSVAAFLWLSLQNQYRISAMEMSLIIFNAITLIYTAYWGVQAEVKK